MKRFLGTDPWSDFKSSRFWGRYLQWKQLEWNMKISASDFDVHRILGRGGFGEVFGCRKFDTGALFAMKKLDKKRLKLKHQEATAVHERNVLAEMSSKFVSNLKYAFHDKDTLYLVLDLLEGGDLNWHLKKLGTFTEAQAKFYAAEIVMGVAHIHDNSMIYRDLKPANVLLDGEGHARISDLGLVRDIKPGKSLPTSECGTHGYMAPEVLEKDREYGPASDWFSLGCTIFQFFTGHTPFRDGKAKVKGKTGKDEIGKRTMRGEVPFPEDFPATAKALVAQLLTVDPAKRLGSAPPPQGAADIRAHKWFADVDWQALMDHKVRPAIVPTHGMVNANGVHDIERFDHHDTRKVKITDEDNQKYYQHFGHIMSHNWQEEVQVMYDIVTKDTDAREDKERRRQERTARQGTGFVAVGEDGAGPIMEGVWLKESRRMKAWNKRYVRLYSDCVCWGDTEHAPAKKVCKLESVALAEVADGVQKSFTVTCDGEVSVFRALYQSDHDLWARLLHAAIEARGPDKNDKGLAEALQPDQDAALRKVLAAAAAARRVRVCRGSVPRLVGPDSRRARPRLLRAACVHPRRGRMLWPGAAPPLYHHHHHPCSLLFSFFFFSAFFFFDMPCGIRARFRPHHRPPQMSHHGDVLSDAERMKTLDGLRTGSGGSASFASIPEAAGAN